MPNKPIKRGYKVWVRASIRGYFDGFKIYTGKVGNVSEKNLRPSVIKDLTRSLIGITMSILTIILRRYLYSEN